MTRYILLILLLTSVSWAQRPIAHWAFDGNTSDVSGNGHDGQSQNLTYRLDRFGNPSGAADFNGNNSKITVADAPALRLSESYTLSFWVYFDTQKSTYTTLFEKRNPGENNSGYGVWRPGTADPNGPNKILMSNGGDINHKWTNSVTQISTWIHYVIVYDKSTARFAYYQNGKLDAEISNVPTHNSNSTTPFNIGFDNSLAGLELDGALDDVILFDMAISESEIRKLYKQECLQVHWPMDGNTMDVTGNGHDGQGQNITFRPDRFGHHNGAVEFKDVTSKIVVPDAPILRLADSYTLSFWVYFDALKSTYATIFEKRETGQNSSGYGVWKPGTADPNGPNKILMSNGGGENNKWTSSVVQSNTWTHYVLVYDKTAARFEFYRNGELDNVVQNVLPHNPNGTSPFLIGSDSDVTSLGLDGALDDIRIYGCTLNADEVWSLYQNNPIGLHSVMEGRVKLGNSCGTGTNAPFVQLKSTDGRYRTRSLNDGNYNLHVFDTLQHTYQVVPQRYFSTTCPNFVYKFNAYNDTIVHDFGIKQDTACILLKVDMATARHRRCFDNNVYYIDYRNAGTETAQNAYVHVRLDSLLQPMSSTLPWRTPQQGRDLYFDLGNLAPGQHGQIRLTYKVSCAALWNQVLCSRAHIYPDTSCWKVNPDGTPGEPGAPDETTWDKSSVKVEGRCVNDSAVFTITNTGEPGNGNMDGASQYRVYVNDGLAITQNFQLAGGEKLTLRYYAPGYSIRLEADQRPGHPGHSRPRETVTCGELTAKTTAIPPTASADQNDEDVFAETDCQPVTGSFDPNDKAVYPAGISEKQYVEENTLMEYKVRFQNSGNDTAFTVVVRDTISQHLDLNTLELGPASHSYEFSANGQELVWLFRNINLPDSNVNEPASHGFIKFKIRQKQDLPRGTVVRNRVGIYFDYNDPVITNDAWFTVGDTVFASPISVGQLTTRGTLHNAELKVYPNPTTSSLYVVTPQPGTYVLRNLMGQVVTQGQLSIGRNTLPMEALPAGTYLLTSTVNGFSSQHKVVKQ